MKKLIYETKLEVNKLKTISCDELSVKIEALKKRGLKEELTKIMPQWFAIAQEVAHREIGLRHFDTQLLAGAILHDGKVVEMKTGEGKTLVSTLPVSLNALKKKGVHVVTVNEYLAERDQKWMGKVYKGLGLEVGLIKSEYQINQKQKNYQADITYVTNSEVVFDYLRDCSAYNLNERVQRPFNFCLIDEIDSVLIDESRTPLILSTPTKNENINKLYIAKTIASILKEDIHFEVDEKRKDINLTENGYEEVKEKLGKQTLYDPQDPWMADILNALKANYLFKLNKDYIILRNKIVIVDEFTGRIMEDRRWSAGLHESIEVKENVKIGGGTKTKSAITYQNFFTLYPKLAGMTGTAKTTEREFNDIYNLDVIVLPTVKPLLRMDLPDLVYQNEIGKWKAVLEQSKECFKTGQPLLIGTATIEKSEFLSDLFKASKIPHQILNAKPENVTRESEIVAQAGKRFAVTIATNMAGRGTDIILGGNPIFETKQKISKLLEQNDKKIENINQKYLTQNKLDKLKEEIQNLPYSLDICEPELKNLYENIYKEVNKNWKKENEIVKDLGGLFVLGTERHETRRIDNQLRGRSGRQGDPGKSQFFVSLEDDLIKVFGGDSIGKWVNYLMDDDETPLESNLLSKSLENAQKKVELYNYDLRKNVFEYDDILNSQRKQLFKARNQLVFENIYEDLFLRYQEICLDELKQKNLNKLQLEKLFNTYSSYNEESESKQYEEIWITNDLRIAESNFYQQSLLKNTRSTTLLSIIDGYWTEHIERMSYIRETINWRSYGQQNPLLEYNLEAFKSYKLMFEQIRASMLYYFLNSSINF
mgnify:CR=1 FL=1